jgi:hypothetical protein
MILGSPLHSLPCTPVGLIWGLWPIPDSRRRPEEFKAGRLDPPWSTHCIHDVIGRRRDKGTYVVLIPVKAYGALGGRTLTQQSCLGASPLVASLFPCLNDDPQEGLDELDVSNLTHDTWCRRHSSVQQPYIQ